MKHLFLLNDAPYGNERSYNALRLARSLLKSGGEEVKVFLIGEIGVCGTCIDARGVAETEMVDGALRSTMDGLTAWTQWADKVIVF